MLDTGDVVVVVQTVDVGSSMPCRPACQLVTLQQDHVSPAKLRQMVENRAANKPATDYNCLRMCPHDLTAPEIRCHNFKILRPKMPCKWLRGDRCWRLYVDSGSP